MAAIALSCRWLNANRAVNSHAWQDFRHIRLLEFQLAVARERGFRCIGHWPASRIEYILTTDELQGQCFRCIVTNPPIQVRSGACLVIPRHRAIGYSTACSGWTTSRQGHTVCNADVLFPAVVRDVIASHVIPTANPRCGRQGERVGNPPAGSVVGRCLITSNAWENPS